MASLLDTVGGYQFGPGLPGSPSKPLPSIDTLVNVEATIDLGDGVNLDFGYIVAKDSAADNAVRPLQAGYLSPRGITSRRLKHAATPSANIVGYKYGDEIGVYRDGEVWCMAAEAVTENDQVVALVTPYSPATGVRTNVGGATGGVANGSTRIAMPYHVWRDTVAQGGMGRVMVMSRATTPATTS